LFRAPTATGHEANFRLQLFTGPGTRPVAVATQTTGEGMCLANAAEGTVTLAEGVGGSPG
jgi:hypothetical protein